MTPLQEKILGALVEMHLAQVGSPSDYFDPTVGGIYSSVLAARLSLVVGDVETEASNLVKLGYCLVLQKQASKTQGIGIQATQLAVDWYKTKLKTGSAAPISKVSLEFEIIQLNDEWSTLMADEKLDGLLSLLKRLIINKEL